MKVYIDIALLALIVIYVVDLSGFTDAWRSLLSRWTGVQRLRALPPFDCGQCAVWWTCLVYALAVRSLSLPVVAYVAALAFLSAPLGQALLLIREALAKLIRKLLGKL